MVVIIFVKLRCSFAVLDDGFRPQERRLFTNYQGAALKYGKYTRYKVPFKVQVQVLDFVCMIIIGLFYNFLQQFFLYRAAYRHIIIYRYAPRRSSSRSEKKMGDRGRERDRERSQSRGSRPDGGETTSLLIRNLSYRVRADEIRRLMVRYGEVRDVYIPQVSGIKFNDYILQFIEKCHIGLLY